VLLGTVTFLAVEPRGEPWNSASVRWSFGALPLGRSDDGLQSLVVIDKFLFI
jgi:hypothetical protein